MILVTGATGLVGGHLLWHLLQENENVAAIKRITSNLQPLRTIFSFYTNEPDLYLNKIDWRTADVLDEKSLEKAFSQIDVVYHCAAIVSLGNGSNAMIETNVQGTKNIVKASFDAKISKLCFVSSIAACGQPEHGEVIDEKTQWKECESRSAYSRSKFYSEAEVWKGIQAGLNAVIVNPGVILGVSGAETGSSQLFSQVRKGLVFYTQGGSGYVDVRDVACAMIMLTKSEICNERFILVGENCSNKQILSWMADGFEKSRPWICVGRQTLWFVGALAEVLGKIFRFQPLIDRSMARSATHREIYSSHKIQHTTGFTFTPVSKCIADVCSYLMQ